MTFHEFLILSAVASAVATVSHWLVRRFWLAVLLSALMTSFINFGYELVRHDFAVRPSDVAFWIPMLVAMSFAVALPVVAIIGIPFYVIRRRRKSNVA